MKCDYMYTVYRYERVYRWLDRVDILDILDALSRLCLMLVNTP